MKILGFRWMNFGAIYGFLHKLNQTPVSEFQAYLQLGFDHITDPAGYDHILFVVALCAVYSLNQWREVLILITAFTIGHSLTLALSSLRLVNFRSDVIELLIPITILIASCLNFRPQRQPSAAWARLRYGLALGFGLVHGLGFSNYLRSLLGQETGILSPLFAFNIGLEVGQILIVAVALVTLAFFVNILKVQRDKCAWILSGMVAGMALTLVLNNELFKSFSFKAYLP